MDLFSILFYQPIFNLLIVLYRLFSENLGLAVIAIALISRIITLPVTMRQMKMAETSKELNEKMKSIKAQYKNDKEKQQQEVMKLQSEYLPSQIAGCLPIIIQFILLINIYHVINDLLQKGISSFTAVAYDVIPKFSDGYVVNANFFGIDLTKTPGSFEWSNPAIIPYVIIVILVGVSQFYSMKMFTPGMSPSIQKTEKSKKDLKKKKEGSAEDFSEIMAQTSRQTMFLMPAMIAMISFGTPAALSLYWIAQSSFVIIQQLIIKRLKPKNKELIVIA
jgi:YidC/Oxa1 family membrane protein insertase